MPLANKQPPAAAPIANQPPTAARSRSPDPVDVYVGKRLRTRRVSMGISQERLAAQIGKTFQQLQKYEKAANRISASVLARLATALDCSPDWFFKGYAENGLDRAAGRALPVAGLSARRTLEFSKAFAALDPRDRKVIELVVKGLLRHRRDDAPTVRGAPLSEVQGDLEVERC